MTFIDQLIGTILGYIFFFFNVISSLFGGLIFNVIIILIVVHGYNQYQKTKEEEKAKAKVEEETRQ